MPDVDKEALAASLTNLLNDPAAKVLEYSAERDEIELPPDDGWRCFKPGPTLTIRLVIHQGAEGGAK